ncbi:MAG: 50S ribosomal protein L1 [Acidilobaceae archaeon]
MIVSDKAISNAIMKCLEIGKPRKFKQTIELIITLSGLDLKSPEAKLRETLYLPKGLGKSRNVCVIADGDMLLEARKLGLNVYSREDIQALDKKNAKKLADKCDWVLVKADLMGVVGKILGPALGPRGKAPIPIPPNISLSSVVNRYSKSIWVRIRNQLQIACPIGVEDMSLEDLTENAKAVLSLVESKLGAQKIKNIYVKKTMSPPVSISLR